MRTLPAWMIAQELDRYARDAMHLAALRDARPAKSARRSSALAARLEGLRRFVLGGVAEPTPVCCVA